MNSCASQKGLSEASPDILSSSSSVKGAIVDIPKLIPRNDNSPHTAVIGFGRPTPEKNEHKADPHKNVCASFEYSVFSLRRFNSSFQPRGDESDFGSGCELNVQFRTKSDRSREHKKKRRNSLKVCSQVYLKHTATINASFHRGLVWGRLM